jgi:ABC-type antimicrobial peptide transport system permease subunit
VKDAVSWNLRTEPSPGVYVSCFQSEPQFTTFELDATGSLTQVASAVRREFQPRLPGAPVQIRTLTAQVESALVQERLMATLAGSFGTLALVLASVGLYGLLTCTVARRTNEIGIRMALGAERPQVVWLVIRDAVRLLVMGVGLGLPAAWAASRFVSSMLFGLTATDPPTMFAATLLLAIVGLLAGALPAWRASRVDPMVALRYE